MSEVTAVYVATTPGRKTQMKKTEFDEEKHFEQLVKGKIDDDYYRVLKDQGKYKIGVRVRATTNHDGANIKGEEGKIVYIENLTSIAVSFDKHQRNLHDCNGKCESEHGWWIPAKYLEIID